jgi:hypothetical protein
MNELENIVADLVQKIEYHFSSFHTLAWKPKISQYSEIALGGVTTIVGLEQMLSLFICNRPVVCLIQNCA